MVALVWVERAGERGGMVAVAAGSATDGASVGRELYLSTLNGLYTSAVILGG
jgi:hypothetical protein